MIDMDVVIPLRLTRHRHGYATRYDWTARWPKVRAGARSWPQGRPRASDGDKAGGEGAPMGPI